MSRGKDIVAVRVDEIKREFRKIFREIGTDLGRVSSDCGCTSEPCAELHGKIISVLGKTKGYATLDEINTAVMFNSDTYHRIDYVDPCEI